ncbi:hypothetical protein, partial [Burkholderia sp. Ac-20379]|uniref:hypothetical protein n=1 Tax=Burkholderia sp. Ac-20379 TaxID=2703900 RepID=UPI00197D2C18
FKEHFREKLGFVSALRFQQQRSEIMKNILKRVNYFFQRFDQHTASIEFFISSRMLPATRRFPCPALLPLPFCVSVTAREAEF